MGEHLSRGKHIAMKVMLLAPGKTHSYKILRMLLDSGHNVIFLGDDNLLSKKYPGYRFFYYPAGASRYKSKFSTVNQLIDLLRHLYLKAIGIIIKPDIVHVQMIDIRAFECVWANLHPLILTAWGSDINYLTVPEFYNKIYVKKILRALSLTDHITADTDDILQKCESFIGHKSSSSLYYIGIDFTLFKPGYLQEAQNLKRAIGIPQDHKVILSVRAFKPKLGHHLILGAFAQLVAEPRFRNTHLVFKRFNAFSNKYEDRIKLQLKGLGLENLVTWIDAVPDEEMPILYAMSDVVVNYPEMDGFPVSFLEAAACKRPVVSAILPAYADTFPEGSFWMVPPNNIHELAGAFAKALSANEAEIDQRTGKAFAHAEKIGEWNQWARITENLYRQVASQSGNRSRKK
jgi:glycosyltransferase involved in cell wall biosynthesis